MTEIEKWSKACTKAKSIFEFVEFLKEKDIILCKRSEKNSSYFLPILERSDDLIYQMFDIDVDKLEEERVEYLKEIQEKNKKIE